MDSATIKALSIVTVLVLFFFLLYATFCISDRLSIIKSLPLVLENPLFVNSSSKPLRSSPAPCPLESCSYTPPCSVTEHDKTNCKRKALTIVNSYLYTMSCTTKYTLRTKPNTYHTKYRTVIIVRWVQAGLWIVLVRMKIVIPSNKPCTGILGNSWY
jgi:hypothetical protein